MTIERIETVYGPMWIPDTDTHQYGWLKNIGVSFEDIYIREVLNLLAERKAGVAIDVGACFGCWSLALTQVCKRVIAFEPQLEICKLLLKTLGEKDYAVVINAAAGDREGTWGIPVTDLSKPANFGDVALGADLVSCDNLNTVHCAPLDVMVEGEPVTFIKIDVQGMEAAALRGADLTIMRCRPLLFIEAHPDYADVEALRAQITDFGYAVLPRGHNYLAVPL